MPKRSLIFITLFIAGFLFIAFDEANAQSLQEIIDRAEKGETIRLPDGTYEEPIVIDKPIQLVGSADVVFKVKSDRPAITIKANGATLEQIAVEYESGANDTPAILIQGSQNVIRSVTIETASVGILLDDAHENLLSDISITGDENLPIRERRRGIDLWKADRNTIEHAKISHVEDGIYEEFCEENVFRNNIVTHSRYGYHLMFTERTELYHNESYENISGMMIMGTKETHAYENTLKFNQEDVQSLGLLLYDVYDSRIEHNTIAHNRIGILVEEAYDNEISYNDVTNNFIGLQFKRAENNVITHNAFDANVSQGQAEDSMMNETNANYWSDHHGLDVTGDGMSDLSYQVDPFYMHLANKYPAFRLLFQSPGMIFLDSMMHTPKEEQLVDASPLMENPLSSSETFNEHNTAIAIISTTLFLMSIITIYMGVRQT